MCSPAGRFPGRILSGNELSEQCRGDPIGPESAEKTVAEPAFDDQTALLLV